MTSANSARVSIMQTTHGKLPRLPFQRMKDEVLGPSYELSVAFIGERRSRTLNVQLRDVHKPASVLSFPLDENAGEILITPAVAQRRARDAGISYRNAVAHLFIHGLLHLKGFTHSSTMDEAEAYYQRYFQV